MKSLDGHRDGANCAATTIVRRNNHEQKTRREKKKKIVERVYRIVTLTLSPPFCSLCGRQQVYGIHPKAKKATDVCSRKRKDK
jgi:hypothetical protein